MVVGEDLRRNPAHVAQTSEGWCDLHDFTHCAADSWLVRHERKKTQTSFTQHTKPVFYLQNSTKNSSSSEVPLKTSQTFKDLNILYETWTCSISMYYCDKMIIKLWWYESVRASSKNQPWDTNITSAWTQPLMLAVNLNLLCGVLIVLFILQFFMIFSSPWESYTSSCSCSQGRWASVCWDPLFLNSTQTNSSLIYILIKILIWAFLTLMSVDCVCFMFLL